MGPRSEQRAEWWLREHWGRAFVFVTLDDHGGRSGEHGWVALRKRDVELTIAELERPADDPRETEALRHNIEQLHAINAQTFAVAARRGRRPAGCH